MAAAGKHGGSKQRKRETSGEKGGSKSRFPKQTKPKDSKHFKKTSKGSRPSKSNPPKRSISAEKPPSVHGAIKTPAINPSGSNKRKREENPQFVKPSKYGDGKPFNKMSSSKPFKFSDKAAAVPKKEPKTPREHRLAAKEVVEARKRKRRPNYNLEKELASLWEKMRCHSIEKEERLKLVSEALRKISGKFVEVASSHVTARVLQTCLKYGSQDERNIVYKELEPHLLTLSRKKYAVHLVKKLLDTASRPQLEEFFSCLHGNVSSLVRHTVASAVVEHAYHLANGTQRQRLLMEMYSPELQLFKDLTLTNTGSLEDIIFKLNLQKSSVVQHMTSIILPLLQKGIVDYSIVHAMLVEYLTIADKFSAAEVLHQMIPLLSQQSITDESLQASSKQKNKRRKTVIPLVSMMRTRDGLKLGILCIKHGTAKDRKKIVKGIKDHVKKLALDQYGSLLLSCILSVIDDTKLVSKIIIRQLQTMLSELVFDKNGRRPLLQLLHPQCHRYFTPDDLACLNASVPSLCTQEKEKVVSEDSPENPLEGSSEDGPGKSLECITEAVPDKLLETHTDAIMNHNNEYDSTKTIQFTVGGKKEALVRRNELLVENGLAETLIQTCIDTARELLRSNLGKEVIFEVAVGGADGILEPLEDRLADLHKAIASLAALPKTDESGGDHVLENFHSSRTIRKLVLDSPAFAETLWKIAFEGKSEIWAQGHSCKVVSAFLESSEPSVKNLAECELRPLVESGVLKVSGKKELALGGKEVVCDA